MRSPGNPSRRQASAAATFHRWTATAAVVGAVLVVGPPQGLDGLMVGKAALVLLAAVVSLVVAGGAAARAGAMTVLRDPAVVAAGVFAAVLLVVTVLSPDVPLSLAGTFPRWTGAGLYLACMCLFLVVASRFTISSINGMLYALIIVAALLGTLAVGEALDWFTFGGASVSGARATLGNPNFLAGWLATTIPVGAAVALDQTATPVWRRAGAAAAVIGMIGSAATLALQGLLAATAGLAVVFLVWMGSRFRTRHVRAATVGVLAVGALALVLGILGVRGSGPLAPLGDQAGIEHRGYYWQAAVSMISDDPLTGTGPARFGETYRRHRPVEDAVESPLTDVTDAAHSVPLELAAGGGIPLAFSYLAWVGLVSWRLWRGLARLDGRHRMLLGGVGGAWVAYVSQSLVSIDVPPLAVTGWVLAGLVVALASDGATWRLGLPWAPVRGGRRKSTPSAVRVVDGAFAVIAAVLVWLTLLPLRADAGAINAQVTPGGDLVAESGVVQAYQLAGWEPAYGMQVVRTYVRLGDLGAAQDAVMTLVERSPHSLEAVLTAARLAVEVDDPDLAERMYRQALVIEPLHPDLALEVAQFADMSGNGAWARSLVDRALELDPEHPEALSFAEGL